MVTTLNYAGPSATPRPNVRIALRIVIWAWAGVLPFVLLCGAMLDNCFHQEPRTVNTRYTAYHYLCGGIVLWLLIWMIAVVRASPRRWRWLRFLVALAWVGASSYSVYEFVDLI